MKKNNAIEKLYSSEVGNVFILFLFITLCLISYIIFSYQIDSTYASKITGIVFTNIFVGRVPALSVGYASELSHFSVIVINIATEMMMVTSIYSLFVLSFRGMLKVKALEKFFQDVQKKKDDNKEKLEKYGKVGLFIFVFIPFWMTGPIVGAIIGFLIGLKHFTTIFIVFISTIFAVTLWGLFLQELIDFIMIFNTQLVWILLFLFIVGLLILRFRKTIFDKIGQLKK